MANDGGPAFPAQQARVKELGAATICAPGVVPPITWEYDGGMSLRDWFAGQAIAGHADGQGVSKPWAEEYARSAYQIADAMLKAREGSH